MRCVCASYSAASSSLIFALASIGSAALGWVRWDLALLLPLSILARGMLRLSYARATGDRDFKGLGRAILMQALVQPVVLLTLVLVGVEDVLCFALADIIGHNSGVAYLLVRQGNRLRGIFAGWSMAAIVAVARRWKSLPLYNLSGIVLLARLRHVAAADHAHGGR